MSSELPESCTSLSNTEKLRKDVTVMGVITDCMPPAPTRGIDWQMSFTIEDGNWGNSQRVKLFAKEGTFPTVKSTGDVILLRGIKLKDFNGTPLLLSNFNTNWTVFSFSDIPKEHPEGTLKIPFSSSARAKAPAQDEMAYAIELASKRHSSENQEVTVSTEVGGGSNQGCREDLIENIANHRFYNLIGQVVKWYNDSNQLTIYVTDYTNNKLLYNYDAETDPSWEGPKGQFTLAITLWDPHDRYFLENIRKNDYIDMRHVHVRYSKNVSRLEGVIHTDKRFPSRVDIHKVVIDRDSIDDRTKDFLRRKGTFVKNFGDWTRSQGKKRAPEEQPEAEPKSKAARKRERQNQKKREKKAEEQSKNASKQAESLVDQNGVPISRREVRRMQDALNENVACQHEDYPVRSLSSILDREKNHKLQAAGGGEFYLPWQNLKRRADVRVVDFFPTDVRDFAVRDKVSEMDLLRDDDEKDEEAEKTFASDRGMKNVTRRPPDADQDDDDDAASDASSDYDPTTNDEGEQAPGSPASQASQDSMARGYRYAWRFALLVEDRHSVRGAEPSYMVLNVGGEEAGYLLGVLPCDLRKKKNRKVLAQVREKLWTLWGDLEERRQQQQQQQRTVDADREEPDIKEKLKERLTEKPNSRPFACCIQEYAVRLPGEVPAYERRFSLFGTRIR